MGTPGKDRQAAFKAKMREAGKRQITIWVDPKQEEAVKGLLAREGKCRQFTEEEISALCLLCNRFGIKNTAAIASVPFGEMHQLLHSEEVKPQLQAWADWAKSDGHLRSLEYDLGKRQHEIEGREKALAARASEITSYNIVASTNIVDRVNQLVANFTTRTDSSGVKKKIDMTYQANEAEKEMVSLSRQTSMVRTTIRKVLDQYGKQGVLIEKEASILEDAACVLYEISRAAGQAKDRVKAISRRVAAEEDRRKKESVAALKRLFPEMQCSDAILILEHLNKYPMLLPYGLKEIKRLVPGDSAATYSAIEDTILRARREVRDFIEDGIKTGRKADAVADELMSGFQLAKPALMEKHGDIVRHAVTCLTAARFVEANQR